MICIKRDVTDPVAAPVLMGSAWVNNADGTSNLQMPDGTWAYPDPGDSYRFHFSATQRGAYQDCRLNGQLVGWHTRPHDAPQIYSWVELPN